MKVTVREPAVQLNQMRSSMLGLKSSACSSDFFCSYNSIIKTPPQEPFNCLVNQFVNFFYFSVNCLLKSGFQYFRQHGVYTSFTVPLFSFEYHMPLVVHTGQGSPKASSAHAKHPSLEVVTDKNNVMRSWNNCDHSVSHSLLLHPLPLHHKLFFILFLCESERG